MFEYVISVINHVYEHDWMLKAAMFYIWTTLAVVSAIHLAWLIIDDVLGEDPWFPRIFLCWLYSRFSPRSTYNDWMSDFDRGDDETEAALFIGGFVVYTFGIAFATMLFPLTITLIISYAIVIGLRSLRRIQKRVDNVSRKE